MSWIYPRLKTRLRLRDRDSRQDQDLGFETQDKTKTLKSESRDISRQDMRSWDYVTGINLYILH